MEQNSIEIWKSVVGYEGRYEVSNMGRVRSVARRHIKKNGVPQTIPERLLVPRLSTKGYVQYALSKHNKLTNHMAHRLVCVSFNGLPVDPSLACLPLHKVHVNHKDLNKVNNRPDNLEWCSHVENMRHARERKVFSPLHGRKGPYKLTPELAEAIRLEVSKCERSRREICAEMGVPFFAFQAAATGFTWTDTPTPVGNRANKSYACPFKHPGKRKKLTPALVAEIRSLGPTTSVTALANQFMVSGTTIRKILKGTSWVVR